MTDPEFVQIIAFLSGAYPERKVAKETITTYKLCLHDLPFEAAKAAVLDHISSNKWFPTVAELRQAAFALIPHERIPTAIEAWGEVVKNFDWPGRYGEPTFSHPAITKAVEALGWQQMCNSENADVLRGEFSKLYSEMARRLEHDQVQMPEVRRLRDKLAEGQRDALPDAIKRLADAKRVNG